MAKVKIFSGQVNYGEVELAETKPNLESVSTLEKILNFLKSKSRDFEGLYIKDNQIFLFDKHIQTEVIT